MNWVWIVLFGATINACANYGYKYFGRHINHSILIALVMMVASVVIAGYATFYQIPFFRWVSLEHIAILVVMGFGTAVTYRMFVHVLTCGMISLADPLWACVYALVSILIGMGVAAETPKVISLLGVGLYIVGAFLIALGARKNTMKGTNHV